MEVDGLDNRLATIVDIGNHATVYTILSEVTQTESDVERVACHSVIARRSNAIQLEVVDQWRQMEDVANGVVVAVYITRKTGGGTDLEGVGESTGDDEGVSESILDGGIRPQGLFKTGSVEDIEVDTIRFILYLELIDRVETIVVNNHFHPNRENFIEPA